MKPQNNSSLPRENNEARRLFTRRSFLKVAATSAAALPFLKPGEVLATGNTPTFKAGCNWQATGFDTNFKTTGYKGAGIYISGVHGYSNYFGTDTQQKNTGVPAAWGDRVDGRQKCLTIYPKYGRLMNGEFDKDLCNLFHKALPGDMLTAYQEADNLAIGHQSRLLNGTIITVTGAYAQNIQSHLLLIKQRCGVKWPMIGAIGFNPWHIARGSMASGLDFYALDVYHSEFHPGYRALQALDAYREGVPADMTNGLYRPISVMECNCLHKDFRPNFFLTVAQWVRYQSSNPNDPMGILSYNGNPDQLPTDRGFYTFWNWDTNPPPPSSGPWLPGDTNTISALNTIADL